MHTDTLIASMAIGAAASLAAMIGPFRRGATGVVVNLGAGVVGALLAALVSFVVLPAARHGAAPERLVFAALGALAGLAGVHAWAARRAPSH